MNWNEGIRECANISKEEKDKIFAESMAKQKPYVEPPAVKVGLKEVWILTDECGHEPQVFADRESVYFYLKTGLLKDIAHMEEIKDEWKYAEQDKEELEKELAELEESYAEGGSLCIDGCWYCSSYTIYQKDREMPVYY